jgi:TRAP-type C4-dicarboxylate transport system permease small subunit
MSANKSDAVIGAMLVLLGVFVLIAAHSFPPRTQLYVNLVSLAMIISAAILLAKALYAQWQLKGKKGPTLTPDKPLVWLFILANMCFVGAIYLVGFHVAAFLFLLGSTVLLGQKKLLTSLLVSGFVVGCLYVIFVIFLKVPLPKGVLLD